VRGRAALLTVAAAGSAAATLRRIARRAVPPVEGTVALACLDEPVEILRDRYGIPHVYARSALDLARAHGYVHAQDRLFQMEMLRRFAFGRLSEIAGARTLELDRMARRLRLRWSAEREAAAMDADTAARVAAYCEGVNEFIATGPLPVELRIARIRPEPWTPVDVQAPGRMFALTLCGNWESELLRMQLVERFGEARARRLDPIQRDDVPVVPSAVVERAERRARWLRRLVGSGASNSWVLGGSRTATGKPLLANDPHLLLTIPSLWHAAHLSWDGGNVVGVSVPGVPVVILGRNERVAWGMTTAMVDTQDLYVERFREDGRYEAGDEWLEPEVVREEIAVRGRSEPAVEEVVVTRHGPVVAGGSDDRERLALRWSEHEPSETARSLYELMTASDVDEAERALDRFAGPPHNFVLADVDGAIGYRLAGGPIPVRDGGEGFVPVSGWDDAHEWSGYIPAPELPRLRDPESARIVTANNRIVGDDYPHRLRGEFFAGYRARRIEGLLDELDAVSVEDCRRILLDQTTLAGVRLAELARDLDADDVLERAALDLLTEWDGSLEADSGPGAVYSILVRRLFEAAYGDVRGLAASWPAGLFERSRPHVLAALAARDDTLLPAGRTWDDVVRDALSATVRDLGPDPTAWRWGERHRLRLEHAFHSVPVLGRFFDRGPYEVGGDGDTISVFVSSAGEPEGQMVGPSMRAVYDLSDPDGTYLALTPGQSGHVASPHYDDLLEPWLEGELHRVPLTRRGAQTAAETRLVLEPAGIAVNGRAFTGTVGG
jgi:penicillin amidase